ncbi:MAG: ABC transporter ATP-binding protein [Halanaerobiales bacterium]|nr:ABC transporter ATP-binding protein [Halanaerobiales bacterium]
MSDYVLKVSNLKKSFKDVKALTGVSFSVEKGVIFGMLGPNGAGKTTTIETLTGLNKRDQGQVDILGLDPANQLKELQKKIGVQLQSPALFPRLKVVEIIKLFSSFYKSSLSTDQVLEQIDLMEKKDSWVKNLSGGQKHRLAVGLAIVSNGEIIFLDEPTTGLDPQARIKLWEVIRNLKKEGKTVFLTTHYMDEAEKLCDDLVILDRGRIITQGSPEHLIDQNFDDKVIEFRDQNLSAKFKDQLKNSSFFNKISFEEKNNHILIYTDQIRSSLKRLFNLSEQNNIELEGVIIRKATLEDVFLKLTGREYNDETI